MRPRLAPIRPDGHRRIAVLLELGAIHRSSIGYLRCLVMPAQVGWFHRRYAGEVLELDQSFLREN